MSSLLNKSQTSNLKSQTSTICALATAPGGALGIIRISGPQTLEILSRVFTKNLTEANGNTIHYGHIKDGEVVVDEVLVSVFRAPHSYTGEESAEITCHGSRYILNKVLALLIENGCRQAGPGEFTQRAYLNGKMDLSQAEAVADLIASSNKATHQMAMSQLRGHFSSQLAMLREQLLKLTSLLELELDFSDHEDLEFADRSELLELTKTIDNQSTLLNALLKDDRAIVSDIHGTTRDTIEDTIDINGITFRFIDTAGIRQTSDEVEQIGIERTYAAIEKARIVLWLIDTNPTAEEIQEMQERCSNKSLIIIINKIDKQTDISIKDLSTRLSTLRLHLLSISAKFGTNLSDLESAIYQAADIPSIQENDIIVSNARHYDALTRAHDHIQRVIDGLQTQLSGDLLSEDLRQALDTLAEITGGQITPNEVLGNIFTHFCVGK